MSAMIHAHRGASAALPENTMEAFSLALAQKADFLELDIHLTKDSEIVVAHDATLERTSDGSGYVGDRTLEELKLLNFAHRCPERAASRIPTLAEVFDLVKPTGVSLNIELKTTERLYPLLPAKLAALINEFKLTERVLCSSFNHYSLVALRAHNKKVRIGLLYQLGLVDPWVYAKHLGADAIHPHYAIIAALPETVARCHENGVAVNVWTVDEPSEMQAMMSLKVDGIITNNPGTAVAVREAFLQKNGADER
ncbi:MAG: glycerophosphodiester phosphodiesterase [Oscillospiraceae bacterium]|jgi:glycerophosphoryl diester phosphodiesterase|nr:glycerophosphodiester phosphodiesterase [Oscillospiraceae bacterium]